MAAMKLVSDVAADWAGAPSSTMITIGQVDQMRSGLPLDAADDLAAAIAPLDRRFKYHLVSKATYARRRGRDGMDSARLSQDESERLTRLARLWAFACEIWGGEDGARRFLGEPHALLDGHTPLALILGGELGGRLVEEVLGRLAYGSAA